MQNRSRLRKLTAQAIYLLFALGLAVSCYRRPVTDDFDRYVYEALVRAKDQEIGEIYPLVKHESLRAESSSVMDSPEHLAELEPLYAIRPLYVQILVLTTKITGSPQKAINLTSAVSLFLVALMVAAITGKYLYSGLLVLTPGILTAGRIGTPDALSALAILIAYFAVCKNRMFTGSLLLMLSIWIRTDNVLFVLAMLVWLLYERKLKFFDASALGTIGVVSVFFIDSIAGNYGWKVLFHYSFIGGKYPAMIASNVDFMDYVKVFLMNTLPLAPQVVIWLLLAIVIWKLKSPDRIGLIPILTACGLHYGLYPSPESRYFVWAYLLIGALFIRAVEMSRSSVKMPELENRERAVAASAA